MKYVKKFEGIEKAKFCSNACRQKDSVKMDPN